MWHDQSGGVGNSKTPNLYKSKELAKTARFSFFRTLESNQKLTIIRGTLKEEAAEFWWKSTFNLPTYHPPLCSSAVAVKITAYFSGAVCQYQREQYGPYSQKFVIMCFDLSHSSLTVWLKGLPLFCLSQSFPRKLLGDICSKYLKAMC